MRTIPTNKVAIFILVIFSGIIFNACRQAANDRSSEKTNASFTPHPKKVEKHEVKTLSIGAEAPDFNLPGTSGKFYSLKDFSNADVLVIVFTCNHCPTAKAYEDRIIQFTKEYSNKGVSVVAIMPNSTLSLLPEECGYTDLNDSFEEMIVRAKDKNYNFPYLYN